MIEVDAEMMVTDHHHQCAQTTRLVLELVMLKLE
jgi:hypothetical protein